jgi:hypothetical protein
MMSAQVLRLKGAVTSRSEAAGLLRSPGDAVIVERGRPRLLMLACPCGCGEEFPVNLDPRAGPAWRLYRDRRDRLTVFPSVWRESGCRSHYIIWGDKIFLFGGRDDTFADNTTPNELQSLVSAVQQLLPRDRFVAVDELADALNAIPWDVLAASRRLVRSGLAREGIGPQRAQFQGI